MKKILVISLTITILFLCSGIYGSANEIDHLYQEWSNCSKDNVTEDEGDHYIKLGIFADNFNDGDENWSESNGNWTISDGKYQNSDSDKTYFPIIPSNATNKSHIAVLAKMRRVAVGDPVDNGLGLILNYQSYDVWNMGHFFFYGANNQARIIESVNGVNTFFASVNVTPPVLGLYYYYKAQINSSGQYFKFWEVETDEPDWIANNKTSPPNLTTGKFGIGILNNAVSIDEFRAWNPDATHGNITTQVNDCGYGYSWNQSKWNGTSDIENKVTLWGNASDDNENWTGWIFIKEDALPDTYYEVPSILQKQYYKARAQLQTYNQSTPVLTELSNKIIQIEQPTADQTTVEIMDLLFISLISGFVGATVIILLFSIPPPRSGDYD